jgi:small subunit ribosomal protein S6
MNFYELVFIVRQNISSSDIDKIRDEIILIIKDRNGEIINTEYWGLRTLAYEIANNKKGHYIFLGIKADITIIKETKRRIKLNDDIIRFSIINVKSISTVPSPILKGKNSEEEEIVVDITY